MKVHDSMTRDVASCQKETAAALKQMRVCGASSFPARDGFPALETNSRRRILGY